VRRWRGAENTPPDWERCVATVGVFDGVHRGHQQILRRTIERAKDLGLPALVVTFDPHPASVVRPGTHPAVLTSVDRKAELLAELGIDALCVQPFTPQFSLLSPPEFVRLLLVQRLHVAAVVVGENFRFGHQAAGDVPLLRRLGEPAGIMVEGVPLARADESDQTAYSSTAIRASIAAGDVTAAARALGREHRVEGVVVLGDRRGRTLGYPTANVATAPHTAIPADGVYAGRLVHGGRALPAAVSVGTNPTFAGEERRVEAYVLDFDGDLYGEHVGVDFTARLRGMVAFPDVGGLLDQMAVDVAQTRTLLAGGSVHPTG
jgi:riboflavin kinase/FMN adenylyltransferase